MENWGSEPFVPAEDAAAADWVLENLGAFGRGVESLVPRCFESYARVFHPTSRLVTDRAEAGEEAASVRWPDGTVRWVKPVTWAEVAAANGRVMHGAADWGSLVGEFDYNCNQPQPGIWDSQPELGGPPLPVAGALVAVLERFTSTPNDCWFGISEIWGSPLHETLRLAPRFGTSSRAWFLLRGTLYSGLRSPQLNEAHLPDLWWPEDRSWFVGSDVDLITTYVGGSEPCIEALLQHDSLEVFRVSPDHGITYDSDTINPLPPRRSNSND
jgi:hypothetical protein